MIQEVVHQVLRGYMRHSPLQKGKERLLQAVWQPLSSGRTHRITTLKKSDVLVQCDLTQWVQRHLYFFGEYEPLACRYWKERARTAYVIMDVGANVGVYALLAASVNRFAQIHAFEPTPEVFAALARNVRLNKFDNIQLHPRAIGESCGNGFLQRCRGSDGLNEGMNYVTEAAGESDTPVAITSLDEFCAEQGVQEIDLLKLDIEGGELSALLGAQRLFSAKKVHCLLFELVEWAAQRFGHSANSVAEFLRGNGYELFRITQTGLLRLGKEIADAESVVAFPENCRS